MSLVKPALCSVLIRLILQESMLIHKSRDMQCECWHTECVKMAIEDILSDAGSNISHRLSLIFHYFLIDPLISGKSLHH